MHRKIITNIVESVIVVLLIFINCDVVRGQSCAPLSSAERRNCYPWSDLDRSKCEERGCVYCEDPTPGVPWCFINDEVCPSTIQESERVDCPGGTSKDSCLAGGCFWCPTASAGVPWCFRDSSTALGGRSCPVDIPAVERVDCIPEDYSGSDIIGECLARGCYWCDDSNVPPDTPYCFTPRAQGYRVLGDPQLTAKGFMVQLERINSPSWFGADISRVNVDIEYHSNERLRVKNTRYEVPTLIDSPPGRAPDPLYEIVYGQVPSFYLRIIRKSTGTVLFDTSMGGLIFSDQFIQITTRLPSNNLYGFGETKHSSFRHDMNWKHWSMWARDEPVNSINLYGVHPFYTVLENDGNMHGGLFLNANAQGITVTQLFLTLSALVDVCTFKVVLTPAPGITYRTIGGVLDLYLFLGPEPETVMQQYHKAIGTTVMPAYWSLGFHLSRYGYGSLASMQEAINRMRQYDIPQDVQHGDIDYFDRNMDFTYDQINYAGLPEYVRQLKTQGTRFITILDPFIESGEPSGSYPPYDRGLELDTWVKVADGVTDAKSKVWPPTQSVYPDYGLPQTVEWWAEQCESFHRTIEFDGLWVDMNEPASFDHGSANGCANNKWNFPIYLPRSLGFDGDPLFQKTVCTDYLIRSQGRHYDVHSLFGVTSARATVEAIRRSTGGKRSIIISRSSFPGSGAVSGRWLGDNHATWESMRESIIGTFEYNMFGIPYIGADICGFFLDSYPELCSRWMQLGSFYPFSRNHNGMGWQDHDPGLWPEVAAVSRDTLRIRYRLLPFLYTLFHLSHVNGGTVFRPLHHEFPTDPNTYSIDRQFLWGPSFLVTPVLDEGATGVVGYFPDARWYRYRDGALEPYRGQSGSVNAPLDFIPLHVRGGHILPKQAPANSTMFSRLNPMGLIVALDDSGSASGQLFWDEGDTPDTYENGEYFLGTFTASNRQLTSRIDVNGYPGMGELVFDFISVWGVSSAPSQVLINGVSWSDYTYDSQLQTLDIGEFTLTVNQAFTVQW